MGPSKTPGRRVYPTSDLRFYRPGYLWLPPATGVLYRSGYPRTA